MLSVALKNVVLPIIQVNIKIMADLKWYLLDMNAIKRSVSLWLLSPPLVNAIELISTHMGLEEDIKAVSEPMELSGLLQWSWLAKLYAFNMNTS